MPVIPYIIMTPSTGASYIFGNPIANLGPDRTVQALSHTLDAGSGYIEYLWDNSSTSQTRTIDRNRHILGMGARCKQLLRF